jgi:ArsR family transcriptional regulator, repressor of sdpIR and other operons
MAARDKQFRALADPTRRDILRLLRDGPLTSGAIADSFPSAWATVSRHLAVLREADLVVAERAGRAIRYELNTSVFQDVLRHLSDWVQPTPVPSRRHARVREQRA